MIVRLPETSAASLPPRSRAVALGNFDGVHLGHQAIVRALVASSRARSLEPSLLTFEPHPSAVVGTQAPPLLTTLERKDELVRRLGVETVFACTFDAALSTWSPDRFVRELLHGTLGARAVFVGDNFRFGAARAGNLALLQAMGKELGFEAYGFGVVRDAKGPLSSSRARAFVAAGDLELAQETLGRPHSISGVVAHGDERGRTIGFPTANLEGVCEIVPPNGVYAILVDALGDGEPRALAPAVMNIGVRPTVGGEGRRTIEAHLLDFEGDLYGRRLRGHLIARLRDEQKFSSLAELKSQIARDVTDARARLSEVSATPADPTGATPSVAKKPNGGV